MKVAIIGAGAIGGFVGARLALSGQRVTFIARGANLTALQERGLRLRSADGVEEVIREVDATDNYAKAGPHDLIILAVKAHQVAALAAEVPQLFHADSIVVPMQNGIPYWYFHQHGGVLAGTRVRSVDPTGSIHEHIPCERVLGCVVYPAAELVAPAIVQHVEGYRFPVGELDGSVTERVKRVSEAFVAAKLQAPILDDIRAEIWLKLWGNLAFNPISALTRATLAAICQYPLSRALAANMMTEAQTVAGKLDITFRVSLEKRISGAERVGHHKTSMLQDVEATRSLEVDALLGSVIELARLTETPTPHLDTVFALTKLLGEGLQPGSQSSGAPPGTAA